MPFCKNNFNFFIQLNISILLSLRKRFVSFKIVKYTSICQNNIYQYVCAINKLTFTLEICEINILHVI